MYMSGRTIPRNRPMWVLNGVPMRCKSVEAWEHTGHYLTDIPSRQMSPQDVTVERLDGTRLQVRAARLAISVRHTGRRVYWISA